ncbi:MAG TPA: hypothetical protein VKM54_08400 [Myxococcota bacterium]|nr:hypothetical protein [Myxococcota bacterium]
MSAWAPAFGRGARASAPALLAYPPPYRAWLALSNDPDGTEPEAWREVHALVWEELALPFADSFFVASFNPTVPRQVNLADDPEILSAHPHDTMHGWGDWLGASERRFHRGDAERAVERLAALGARPLVWTDHANSPGNLLHRGGTGAVRAFRDTSGWEYPNGDYALDLALCAGVRYAWDGDLVEGLVGQDRSVGRREWYRARVASPWRAALRASIDCAAGRARRFLPPNLLDYAPDANRAYRGHAFPDGSRLYLFRRFGAWARADIDGLADVLSAGTLRALEAAGGTAIVYTHLGKRARRREGEPRHVPPRTRDALERLAESYAASRILLSATSTLLDYLVLRDHARASAGVLDFRGDAWRFAPLRAEELARFTFGVRYAGREPLAVLCEGAPIACAKERLDATTVRLSFPEPGAAAARYGRDAARSRAYSPACRSAMAGAP